PPPNTGTPTPAGKAIPGSTQLCSGSGSRWSSGSRQASVTSMTPPYTAGTPTISSRQSNVAGNRDRPPWIVNPDDMAHTMHRHRAVAAEPEDPASRAVGPWPRRRRPASHGGGGDDMDTDTMIIDEQLPTYDT